MASAPATPAAARRSRSSSTGHLPSMLPDANRFFAAHGRAGLRARPVPRDLGPGFADSCGTTADAPEEPLDVEPSHIIAPDAKVLYVAAGCDDAERTSASWTSWTRETRIVDGHLADVEHRLVQHRWSPTTRRRWRAAWTRMMEQGAPEGIGFNFDSGDGGDGTPAGVRAGGHLPGLATRGDRRSAARPLEIGQKGSPIGELGWGDHDRARSDPAGTRYLDTAARQFTEGSTRRTQRPSSAEPRTSRASSGHAAHGRDRRPEPEPPRRVGRSPTGLTGWLIGYTVKGSYISSARAGPAAPHPIVAALSRRTPSS